MKVLTLSDRDHVYRYGDEVVTGTTEAINAAIPRRWEAGKYYLTRGSAIHAAIPLALSGELDWEEWSKTLGEGQSEQDVQVILGKVKAAQKFFADTGYRILESEVKYYSKSLRYAGTIDCLIGIPGETVLPTLCDYKSSIDAQLEVQLGLYYRLLRENGQEISKALGLELQDAGNYHCKWFNKHELKRAEQIGHACLTIHGFSLKHKLNPTEKK